MAQENERMNFLELIRGKIPKPEVVRKIADDAVKQAIHAMMYKMLSGKSDANSSPFESLSRQGKRRITKEFCGRERFEGVLVSDLMAHDQSSLSIESVAKNFINDAVSESDSEYLVHLQMFRDAIHFTISW